MNPQAKQTFAVINQMVADGAIENYALAGRSAPWWPIMLKVGRQKDFARVEMLLEQREIEVAALEDVVRRHGLYDKWVEFKSSYDHRKQ